MFRRRIYLFGLLVALGGFGYAQEVSDTTNVGAQGDPGALVDEFFSGDSSLAPDRLISVSYDKKTLREVCDDLTRKLGINFVPGRGLEDEVVDLTLNSVRWKKVVEYLAAKHDLEMETWDDNMIVFTRTPPVFMEFPDADVRVVLDLIARQANKNIVMHREVQGRLSLNLQKVSWNKALEIVAKTAGFAVVPESDDESLVRVIPRRLLSDEIVLEHIQLQYIRPPSIYRAVMPRSLSGEASSALSSGFFIGNPPAPTGNAETEFTLLRALQGILSRQAIAGESIYYDSFSNSLVVHATKPKLIEIKNLIKALDKEPEQVFVDVTFISTTNRNFLEHGLRFDSNPGDGREDGISGGFTLQNSTQNQGVVGTYNQVSTGNLGRDIRAQFLGQYPFILGEDSDIFTKNFMIPGVLDVTQTALLFKFAEFDANSRITQRPTLMTLSSHEATIFVGEQVPFVRQQATTDANGNLSVTLSEGAGSPIAVGFTLFITPYVIPGKNEVIMSVIPRVNTLTGTTSPILGLERFQSGDSFIDLPRSEDQIVVTKLLVESGKTAIIGGLMQERLTEEESRVPILSSIPIIGPLFTWKNHTSALENLLIFITPTIVRTPQESSKLFEEKHQQFIDADFFYGKYKQSPGDLWIHDLDGSRWVDVETDEEE